MHGRSVGRVMDRGQGDDERRVTRASPEPSRVVTDARAASPMSPSTPDAALEPFVERELFGGAILASFPARYVDVSDFRPVPDNQEVWTDANRDESVIVEILERVEAGPSDAEGAAAWFFRDLADVNAASVASGASIIHQTRALTPADLPRLGAPVAPGSSICVGESSMTKARDRGEPNRVRVIVACVRLPEQETDLLITVNQTLVVAPGSSAVAPDAGRGDALVTIERALATVRVADWGLFG